ncbi:hypothetical protein N7462_009008 [Penicillium macrosclerotiorum]|uniref:uncharacterized protein n=1 Tax=Penicillium macrosclerotiorum TaxID=303699 RepID=UPI00254703A3|nr:uncharacterized protein N7462_009008 [Penicillium macrosclerotiorum]KAJ5676111.1 hypothetical protein N7462_009008 [Penicillium macrosclerotiorum]
MNASKGRYSHRDDQDPYPPEFMGIWGVANQGGGEEEKRTMFLRACGDQPQVFAWDGARPPLSEEQQTRTTNPNERVASNRDSKPNKRCKEKE